MEVLPLLLDDFGGVGPRDGVGVDALIAESCALPWAWAEASRSAEFAPESMRVRSAKYCSRSRYRHGRLAERHASHFPLVGRCTHLIFFTRLVEHCYEHAVWSPRSDAPVVARSDEPWTLLAVSSNLWCFNDELDVSHGDDEEEVRRAKGAKNWRSGQKQRWLYTAPAERRGFAYSASARPQLIRINCQRGGAVESRWKLAALASVKPAVPRDT